MSSSSSFPDLPLNDYLKLRQKKKKVEKKILSKLRPSIQRFHTHTANFKRKSWKIKIVSCYSYDIVFNIQLGWPNRHERTTGRKGVLTVDCIWFISRCQILFIFWIFIFKWLCWVLSFSFCPYRMTYAWFE